jgi:cytochrome c1
MNPLIRISIALLLSTAAACKPEQASLQSTKDASGGDPRRGEAALLRYGCIACHTIDGIPQSKATIGPPLTQLGSRTHLAGNLENTPGNLMRWIQNPREVNPGTAMPNVGVTDSDARDITAYLLQFK